MTTELCTERRKPYRATPETFWGNVAIGSPDECWPWTRAVANGYGRAGYGNRVWLAHRLAWTLTNGPISDGLCVCHSCDNPPCCNPAHLWLGTNADNTADRGSKGRTRTATSRGSAHKMAKVTEEDVLAIRAESASGATGRRLAAQYGITTTTVSRIIRRQSWAHL